MYVIAVLEVKVAVVDVIDMVFVRNLFAVIVFGVLDVVPGVNPRLRVPLAIVDVIDVIAVRDRLVSVPRQVFVIVGFGVLLRFHGSSGCR